MFEPRLQQPEMRRLAEAAACPLVSRAAIETRKGPCRKFFTDTSFVRELPRMSQAHRSRLSWRWGPGRTAAPLAPLRQANASSRKENHNRGDQDVAWAEILTEAGRVRDELLSGMKVERIQETLAYCRVRRKETRKHWPDRLFYMQAVDDPLTPLNLK